MPKLEGRTRKTYYTEFTAKERRDFLRELNKDREKRVKELLTQDANKGRRDTFRERMLTALHRITSNGGEDFVPLDLIVQPYGAEVTKGLRCTVLQGKGNVVFDTAYNAARFNRIKIRELVNGVTGSVVQRIAHPETIPAKGEAAQAQPPKEADAKEDKPKAARKRKATTGKDKATVKKASKPKAAKAKGK